MEVYVFKTNVRYKKNVHELAVHLDMIADIKRWNVDLQDKDKILRIEASDLSPKAVEQTLQNAGYFCLELVD
jgi:hypothetical protein